MPYHTDGIDFAWCQLLLRVPPHSPSLLAPAYDAGPKVLAGSSALALQQGLRGNTGTPSCLSRSRFAVFELPHSLGWHLKHCLIENCLVLP